jgi:hypothetical protein
VPEPVAPPEPEAAVVPEPVAPPEPEPEPEAAAVEPEPEAEPPAPEPEPEPPAPPQPVLVASSGAISVRIEADPQSGDLTLHLDDGEDVARFVRRGGTWSVDSD